MGEETQQRKQISFPPMLGHGSERVEKKCLNTLEITAVPAAKCGHICFVVCKSKDFMITMQSHTDWESSVARHKRQSFWPRVA